jgi:tryptophan synthase beta chain
MGEKLRGEADYRIIAVEPASCPASQEVSMLTISAIPVWFARLLRCTPSAQISFRPLTNAGGLRYHGMSPVLSQLYDDGLMEAVSVEQTKVLRLQSSLQRVEGILPAPESSHASALLLMRR